MIRKSIVISFLIIICLQAHAQRYTADIDNLTVDHGLPDNSVYCFFQDHFGFIWIGTHTGISRFDGYVFKHFQIGAGNLPPSPVVEIIGDDHDNLWIATQGSGLYQLKLQTHELSPYIAADVDLGENIFDIFKSSSQTLWIATDKGIFKMEEISVNHFIPRFIRLSLGQYKQEADPGIRRIVQNKDGHLLFSADNNTLYQSQSNITDTLVHSISCKKVLSGYHIQHMLPDEKMERMWIGTSNQGLLIMDSAQIISNFRHHEEDKNTLSQNNITGLAQDRHGNTWIATNNRGINWFQNLSEFREGYFINNNNAGRQLKYRKTFEVFNQLADYNIRALFVDNTDILWIGTQNNGLIKAAFKKEVFRHFQQDSHIDNTLAHRDISFPKITRNGELWIGTWGGGLHYLSPEESLKPNPEYKRFYPVEGDSTSISFPRVFPVFEDRTGVLWLGTNGGGLNKLTKDQRTKNRPKFKRYQYDPSNNHSISNNTIRSICEDNEGNIWIGTNRGLNKLMPLQDSFLRYMDTLIIHEIVEDRSGTLWLGTQNNGLVSWNPALNTARQHLYQAVNGTKQPIHNVRHVAIDVSGLLWLGASAGLFSFNPDGEKFKHYAEVEGMPTRAIESIQIDHKNRLWIGSAENGLFVYEPEEERFTNFKMTQGSMSNSFTQGSSQSIDGLMFFGSRNGFYSFHPDSVIIGHTLPETFITEVKAGEKQLPEEIIYQLNRQHPLPLRFNYDEKVISISFSHLSFPLNTPVKYTYNLKGVDDRWNVTNVGEHRITYSNLQPGHYTFSVKTIYQNLSGRSAVLSIIINPPWWKTWWSYTLSGALSIFLVFRIIRYRKRRRKESERRFKEKVEREKEERLQQLKLELFTNISHEIKTPLTLIKAPVENLLNSQQLTEKNTQYASLIKSNTERLLRLTNQLLDYRKVSLNKMPVKYESLDLVGILEKVCHLFTELAIKNDINFILESNVTSLVALIDQDKLESIVFNLLTNAFKHTSQGGKIEVIINFLEERRDTQNQTIRIKIKDSGVGIPKDKVKEVFKQFYSESEKTNTIQKGTGIGLALVRELVTLMNGRIKVESEESVGTTFVINLDIDILSKAVGKKHLTLNVPRKNIGEPSKPDNSVRKDNGLPVLLIAEDDPELNHFIASQFSNDYRIIQAFDGGQAYKQALSDPPELVITDLMMPVSDGIALCNRLKSELTTSHIPVVMLTAKGQDEDKLRGIQTGADAYLVKPFSTGLLVTTVSKLIEGRRLLREKYSKSILVEPSGITITPMDEKFIQLVLDVVDTHLDDHTFSVEQLAKEAGISGPQLYRKVKAITGLSPNEFIRDLRLKRAAVLLKESGLTISEVSYKVGFSSPKYFSRCFHQQFGTSPKEFKVS